MAQLIKVGNIVINLDNVVDIELEARDDVTDRPCVKVYCNDDDNERCFFGDDAEALRAYLIQQSKDITLRHFVNPMTDAVEGRR